jgi:hypothetical protein
MEQQLPVTSEERGESHQLAAPDAADHRPAYRQDISVAFLPLALITFLFLAFAAAAWTILAAG